MLWKRNGAPILLSIAALRAMGAIIDFRRGLAHFSELHPSLVVQLEKTEGGHLLMDRTIDLYEHAVGHLGNCPRMAALKHFRPE